MANRVTRDRRREARWRRIIRQHARGVLTISEFCRRSNLAESAFYFWRRELRLRQAEQASGEALAKPKQQRHRRGRAAGPDTGPAFVAVTVRHEATAKAQAGHIEIVLSGGQRIYVMAPVDRQALADVLAVLVAARKA